MRKIRKTAAAEGDLVPLEPHPGDLSEGTALDDRPGADEGSLAGGAVGIRLDFQGHASGGAPQVACWADTRGARVCAEVNVVLLGPGVKQRTRRVAQS